MTDLDHVKREFGKLTFMAIDDPYQYVCDYYQDYIITLKKDKRNNGIVDLLRVGYANSCIWGSGQFNSHFSSVYHSIINLQEKIKNEKKV